MQSRQHMAKTFTANSPHNGLRKSARPSRPVKRGTEQPTVAAMMENIVGYKWSLHILASIRHGVRRPGAMTRSMEGLTTKVQNDCLRKMVRFGILDRVAYPEVPPRVEYALTAFGGRFVTILDAIEGLQREADARIEG